MFLQFIRIYMFIYVFYMSFFVFSVSFIFDIVQISNSTLFEVLDV